MPLEIRSEIEGAYDEFSQKVNNSNPEVAIRSSATAEDLPEASLQVNRILIFILVEGKKF